MCEPHITWNCVIIETDDAIHLKLEISGMDAKDLDIQVTEKALTENESLRWNSPVHFY